MADSFFGSGNEAVSDVSDLRLADLAMLDGLFDGSALVQTLEDVLSRDQRDTVVAAFDSKI